MTPFRVDGKLAMITGGTRGIGLAAAEALAKSGANILLVGRDRSELENAAARVRRHDVEVVVLAFDLMNTAAIAEWLSNVCAEHGTPDVLVNSAGMQRRGLAVDLTLDDWEAVMNLNATAMFELSRNVARHLMAKNAGGKIINIASLMTSAARPGTSPYTASKGAVGQLTKVLAIEWAKSGIFVNAIAPGYIDTDLNKGLVADAAFDAWVKGRCPLGRWGTPADIAWPIVFLASAASDFMTGQVMYVDGGWLATF